MPRLKKTAAERRAERFDELYQVSKARFQMRDSEIAACLDISVSTLRRCRQDPGRFQVEQRARLGDILGWSGEDFLRIMGMETV